MSRLAISLILALLGAGCGETWDRFLTPDYGPPRDVAVSPDRVQPSTRVFRAPTPSAEAAPGCYFGKLTDEGDTCQAMRTNDGALLTLGGSLRGFGPGDTVCVCGFRAERQFCRQGVTLIIRDISNTCADIR